MQVRMILSYKFTKTETNSEKTCKSSWIHPAAFFSLSTNGLPH
ncbi:hypothetical protein ACFQZ1_25950 [Bacillus sp. CGMCC 1.60114]